MSMEKESPEQPPTAPGGPIICKIYVMYIVSRIRGHPRLNYLEYKRILRYTDVVRTVIYVGVAIHDHRSR
jgi:hypothetical protein